MKNFVQKITPSVLNRINFLSGQVHCHQYSNYITDDFSSHIYLEPEKRSRSSKYMNLSEKSRKNLIPM
ncbi:MAG: hypothetical protein MHPSP_004631, partial [Paramarteilia canceri]